VTPSRGSGAPMDPERFREVKEALLRARSLEGPERETFLGELAGRDPELRREVESLLAAGERPAAVVETGVIAAFGTLAGAAAGAPPKVPERIGPYRLREVLGEGGMGTVYRAEQEEPIRREVALKVVRGRFAPEWVISRFDSERQALALMNHPNIAAVFDAGADEAGHPWFSMELVPGVPVTEYCDRTKLDTRARLALFLRLCDAIQHAHQKGVIHRDLKPSNVLVADRGEGPVLKVIDFGIAKALDPGAPVVSGAMTRTGHVVGTPSYMSPEQAGAIAAPVDTRSDVYALGVMLYELLCGTRPFADTEGEDSPLEMRRTLGERDPQRPSSRLATGRGRPREEGETIARTRGTSVARLRRELAGDLDNIVLLALRRDPDRRYASVERFASDLRRHLEGLPVAARPDTWRYRSSKFVRRHRAGVGVAAVAAVALVGFVVTLIVQSNRLASERNRAVAAEREARISAARAREQADVAKETSDFLTGLFEGADPDVAKGHDVTARELLDRGAHRVNTELRDRPAVRARLLVTLGTVYHTLADYPQAEALAESAYAIERALPVPRDGDLAEALDLLSAIAHDRRDMPASARWARELVDLRRRQGGDSTADLAASLGDLAIPLRSMGRYAEAESLLREALAIHRRTLKPDDPDLAWDLNLLGYVRYSRGDPYEAERHFREALAIQRRTLKPPNSELAGTLNNLGGIENALGRAAEAESTFREALGMYRTLYGENHPAVARAYGNLALALREGGREAEALPLYRKALPMFIRQVGPRNNYVASALLGIGVCRRDLGDLAGADSCFRAALAIRRTLYGSGPGRELAAVWDAQAELALYRGRAAEAVQLARAALAPIASGLPGEDARVSYAQLVLGAALTDDGRAAEAEPLLRAALASFGRMLPAGHWRTDQARGELGGCLLALGRTAEARPLLEQGAKGLRAALGPGDLRRKRVEARLDDPRLAAR